MVAEIPSTIRMLKMLEPTAFPIAISTSFFLAATIEVTSSGSEVPMDTMVRPTRVWLIPSLIAILLAVSTVRSPPNAMAPAPTMRKRMLFAYDSSFVSQDSTPSISTFCPAALAFIALCTIVKIYTANINMKLRMYIKPIGEYPYKLEKIVEVELREIDDRHYGEG